MVLDLNATGLRPRQILRSQVYCKVVFGHDMDSSDIRVGEYADEAVFEGAAGRRQLGRTLHSTA